MTGLNQGLHIGQALLEPIFEYGVSGTEAREQQRQALVLSRTYGRKMGGTVVALNAAFGVEFELRPASVNQGCRRST